MVEMGKNVIPLRILTCPQQFIPRKTELRRKMARAKILNPLSKHSRRAPKGYIEPQTALYESDTRFLLQNFFRFEISGVTIEHQP